ncbi:MAG: CoB--CoM heterodisulfide reductase iron-sulfur subunit A family protein [Fibrobacteria bacterium]|nr:CoB--CoM heterodisulfide reductase iron-sulfur subunit A family protein [Fibrobacteria bacterium]
MAEADTKSILVVGSGMSGMTAAIEAAEAGYNVYLIEKNPYLGGRVAQLYHYFPKLCSPNCGLEINFRRIKSNPRIHAYTLAEVESVSGTEGNFSVKVKVSPRYVNEKCTACGTCAESCETEIENKFNYGMDKTKAAYLPYNMAFPMRYVIDPSFAQTAEAQKVKDSCKYDAIDLNMQEKSIDLQVASVVWATGWQPYDASKLDSYDFNNQPDVISNVMMERLAAVNGPTKGKIVKPSDGEAPQSVAFVQCAGSRDENHLPYCSGICCLASLKQATYVREQYPDAKIYFFYIDIRATDQLEDFYNKAKAETNIEFVKGKVAKIQKGPDGKPLMRVEDTTKESLRELTADLVVLATGMQPNLAITPAPADIKYDEYGFIAQNGTPAGMYAAGCASSPGNVTEVVSDGTGIALKAVQSVVRRAN